MIFLHVCTETRKNDMFWVFAEFSGKTKICSISTCSDHLWWLLEGFLYVCIGLKSSEISRFYAKFQKCSELAKSKHFIIVFLHVCTEIRKNCMFWVVAEFPVKTKRFQFWHVLTIFGDFLKDFLYVCIRLKNSEMSRFYAYFQNVLNFPNRNSL